MTTAPTREDRPQPPPSGSRAAALVARLTYRPTDRLLGTALAVAACDPPAALHASPLVKAAVLVAAAAAWWAAPPADAHPAATSTHRRSRAARHRTTVLPAAAIAVAAIIGPALWLTLCVAALLIAYLLVTDPWPPGATLAPGRPPATPALATAAATTVVLLAAHAPVTSTPWARLPASLAVLATTTCLLLALRTRRGQADGDAGADR